MGNFLPTMIARQICVDFYIGFLRLCSFSSIDDCADGTFGNTNRTINAAYRVNR